MPSQRSLQIAPIFRLLLKVAVKGTHQCDFPNFCGAVPQQCLPSSDTALLLGLAVRAVRSTSAPGAIDPRRGARCCRTCSGGSRRFGGQQGSSAFDLIWPSVSRHCDSTNWLSNPRSWLFCVARTTFLSKCELELAQRTKIRKQKARNGERLQQMAEKQYP